MENSAQNNQAPDQAANADPNAPVPDSAAPVPVNPAPPPEVISPTKPNPMRKFLVIGFIIALVVLGGAGGYFIGTKTISSTPKKDVTANDNQTQTKGNEATSSAFPFGPQIPIPTPSPCLPGFTFYENDYFALCYPQSMDFKESLVNNDKQVGIEVDFSDDVEELSVQSNYVGNLDKSNCVSNKVVKVSGFQATRNLIKDVNDKGVCQKSIKEFVTLISMGQGESVYYIGLHKKDGSYLPDSLKFNFIEQSFRIKK